jgi:hypothetical protein
MPKKVRMAIPTATRIDPMSVVADGSDAAATVFSTEATVETVSVVPMARGVSPGRAITIVLPSAITWVMDVAVVEEASVVAGETQKA